MHELWLLPLQDVCIHGLFFIVEAGAVLNLRKETLSLKMEKMKLVPEAESWDSLAVGWAPHGNCTSQDSGQARSPPRVGGGGGMLCGICHRPCRGVAVLNVSQEVPCS